MNKTDISFSLLFYLLSIVLSIAGVILGLFFIMNDKEIGIMVIIFSIINSIVLFGISRVLLGLDEMKRIVFDVMSARSSDKDTDASQKGQSSEKEDENDGVKHWTLTKKHKDNIIAYYLKENQKITEKNIYPSPYESYCVVKTNDYIDVIELVGDSPVTLNRGEVEANKELFQWIQSNVFS